ncbi:MAG TPA: hypothetical protein VHC22_21750 [Pirellulales bacterium]|nr:hypothetical protein [Pirellulales bacterium]
MAKGSPAGKSEAVREFLSKHPKANVKEIVAGVLRESGVRVSEKLAGDIKYDKTHPVAAAPKPKKSRGKPSRAVRSAAARTKAASGTKADSIREVARRLPKPVRPRDVIAALAEQGIEATRAQVSQVLKSMGMRPRGRRGAKRAAAATHHVKTGPRRMPAAASASISLADLLAAKRLVNQIGSIELAKEAVDALAKLS